MQFEASFHLLAVLTCTCICKIEQTQTCMHTCEVSVRKSFSIIVGRYGSSLVPMKKQNKTNKEQTNKLLSHLVARKRFQRHKIPLCNSAS